MEHDARGFETPPSRRLADMGFVGLPEPDHVAMTLGPPSPYP